MEKITIPIIDMPGQKVEKLTDAYIELHDTHFRYVVNFFGQRRREEDDALWDKEKTYDEVVARKTSVVGIELCLTKYRQWGVYIVLHGFADNIGIFFDKDDWEDARVLEKRLTTWMLS